MAATLTGAGGVFTRLGKAGYIQTVADAFFNGTSPDDLPQEVEDFLQELDGAAVPVAIRGTVDDIPDAITAMQTANSTFNTKLHDAMSRLLIEQIDADNPLPESRTIQDAIQELGRQMNTTFQTVDGNQPSIAAIAADSGNAGSTIVVQSILNGKGEPLENIYDEDIVVEITAVDNTRNEQYSIRGEDAVARTHPAWPKGSGANAPGVVIDPDTDGLTVNGGFNTFTADIPDNWTLDVGTAVTHVKSQTGTVYLSTACLEFIGDSSTLIELSQDLVAIGANPKPNGQYVLHFATRLDVAAASGTLVVDLYDGSSVIADDQSVNNSVSVNLTSLSTSDWTTTTAVFRLPASLPNVVKVRVRMTTAVPTGSSLYIDSLCLAELTQAYNAGPSYALISTDEPAGLGDRWTSTVTNDYRGAIQTMFWRVFGHPELPLPSNIAGSESINDNLIS